MPKAGLLSTITWADGKRHVDQRLLNEMQVQRELFGERSGPARRTVKARR